MLAEVGRFLWHAPEVLGLQRRCSQAELYDLLMARAGEGGLDAQRAALTAGLSGEVLEVGAGTGLQLGHYGRGARVVAIEPDPEFRARAVEAAAGAPVPVRVVDGTAEALPFSDGAFDHAVCGLVLCSVRDPERALAELRRVVRPGGTVRLLEHVRSERVVPGLLMDLFDPVWVALNKQGCHMNRRTAEAVVQAGFAIEARGPLVLRARGLPEFPCVRVAARR